MRITIIVVSMALLFSCSPRKEPQYIPKHRLSLSDLKFPLIDEDIYENNSIPLLPCSYKSNFVKNNIKLRICQPKMDDINMYDEFVRNWYHKESKKAKMSFSEWYLSRHSATTEYDKNGNIEKSGCNYFGVSRLHYKYDSLGYRIERSGGSCVDIHINSYYYFNRSQCILYEIQAYTPRITSFSIASALKVISVIYKFDSSGYLNQIVKTCADTTYGFLDKYNFFYTSDHKPTSIRRIYRDGANSYRHKETPDASIPDSSVSRYFYHSDQLDSIITEEAVNDVKRITRTYYKNELAVKTRYQPYKSIFNSEWILYKYIKY